MEISVLDCPYDLEYLPAAFTGLGKCPTCGLEQNLNTMEFCQCEDQVSAAG